MANSSFPSDTDNFGGDIPESDLVGEASETTGAGEEEPMPPVAREEEEAEQSEEISFEEGSADADADGYGDSDAEGESDIVGEVTDHHEASGDGDDGDDDPMDGEEEKEEEMNEEPEEITMEIPVVEGSTDSDGKGDAEATEEVYTIKELIRPVSYAETFVNDRQDDVSITFLAKRFAN